MAWNPDGGRRGRCVGIGGQHGFKSSKAAMAVPFSDVLELLESHGWVLQRIWKPYFVFYKGDELPILVQVEDKMVSDASYEKVKRILGEEDDEAQRA